MKMQLEMTRFMDNVSRDFEATTGAYDGDGDDDTSSDFGSGSGHPQQQRKLPYWSG